MKLLTANAFIEAAHLNKFIVKSKDNSLVDNSEKCLLAWYDQNRECRLALLTWQEPHSCRNRLWLEEFKFVSADFSGPVQIIRNKMTEDTYDMEKIIETAAKLLTN